MDRATEWPTWTQTVIQSHRQQHCQPKARSMTELWKRLVCTKQQLQYKKNCVIWDYEHDITCEERLMRLTIQLLTTRGHRISLLCLTVLGDSALCWPTDNTSLKQRRSTLMGNNSVTFDVSTEDDLWCCQSNPSELWVKISIHLVPAQVSPTCSHTQCSMNGDEKMETKVFGRGWGGVGVVMKKGRGESVLGKQAKASQAVSVSAPVIIMMLEKPWRKITDGKKEKGKTS